MNILNRNAHVRMDPIPESALTPAEDSAVAPVAEYRAAAADDVVAGPRGMAVGAPVGAAADGLAKPGASVDAGVESRHWRNQFRREPYYLQAYTFGDYAPAYLTGYQGYARLAGNRYERIEHVLRIEFEAKRAGSGLSWLEARPAIRAAWDRVEAAAAK